jgi:hypothetical protein
MENTDLVDILVSTAGTESVETELLMGISLPAHGRHDLNGQGWDSIWENTESVLLGLSVKDLEARNGDDTGIEVVLVLQVLDGVNADTNIGTSGNESDISLLNVVDNITTLDGMANRGVLELWQILAGKGDDARSVF